MPFIFPVTDIFENFFGGNFSGARKSRTRKTRGRDLRFDLEIELEVQNKEEMLSLTREIRELFSDSLLLSEISGKKIIFTGLDNDKDALKFSKAALNDLPSNFETRFLNENVFSQKISMNYPFRRKKLIKN